MCAKMKAAAGQAQIALLCLSMAWPQADKGKAGETGKKRWHEKQNLGRLGTERRRLSCFFFLYMAAEPACVPGAAVCGITSAVVCPCKGRFCAPPLFALPDRPQK